MLTTVILPIFLVLISGGMVLGMAYLFLKKNSEKEIASLSLQMRKERQKHFLPMRVEAYQRGALLMERIHPGNLVMRLHNPGLPAKAFQSEILKTIREEYDHNVSQQMFVSPQAWEMVRNSKEETIKIINIAGNQMTNVSMANDLATRIFELVAEIGKLPTEITVDYLRKELQELF